MTRGTICGSGSDVSPSKPEKDIQTAFQNPNVKENLKIAFEEEAIVFDESKELSSVYQKFDFK